MKKKKEKAKKRGKQEEEKERERMVAAKITFAAAATDMTFTPPLK